MIKKFEHLSKIWVEYFHDLYREESEATIEKAMSNLFIP